MADPYVVLGVEHDASHEDITNAYRKKAMVLHPDRGGGAEAFQELQRAYYTLRDPGRRARYDSGQEQVDDPNAEALADLARLLIVVLEAANEETDDLVALMRDKVQQRIAGCHQQVMMARMGIRKKERVLKRLKGRRGGGSKDPLRALLLGEITRAQRGITTAEEEMAHYRLMLELLSGYTYEYDSSVREPEAPMMIKFVIETGIGGGGGGGGNR